MKAPPDYERIDLRFNPRKPRFVPDADEALFNPEMMQVQVHRHSPMCNCTSEGARSASPESITTTGSMDSGPAPRDASRNDDDNTLDCYRTGFSGADNCSVRSLSVRST